MEIMWLGHAAFRLKGGGKTIYIDPVEMDFGGTSAETSSYAPEPADIILLTHSHPDHCSPESFEDLRSASTVIVGPQDCGQKAEAEIQRIRPDETTIVGDVEIQAVHAYNIQRQKAPGTPFHAKGSGVGYLLSIEGCTIYHAGDTEPVPEMKAIGPVDVALLPVDGHYTMGPEEALQAAGMVNAGTMIPMHFFETSVERVLGAAQAAPEVNVHVLTVGETWILD